MNDKNIIILDYLDAGTHKEVIAKLDYPASKCHNCQGQMAKYDFQKESKIPYLECAGYKTLIRLRKRRFHCKDCGENSRRRDFLSQEESPDRNHRQKINLLLSFFRISSIFFMENRTKKATKAIWNQTE